MSLIDIARDNLLNIIFYLAEDPSPQGLLWVRNLGKSCKLFYNLTNRPEVWLLLSKSWFQPEHYQTNRLGFMVEVFKYNYPDGSDEYNFIDVDCTLYTDCDNNCKIEECFERFIPTYGVTSVMTHIQLNTMPRIYKNTDIKKHRKLTHAMIDCMCRLYKGKINITYNKEGKWLLDSYYVSLAKNISFPTEFIELELQKYDILLLKRIMDFKDNMDKLSKILKPQATIDLAPIIQDIKNIVPKEHFTQNMHGRFNHDTQLRFPSKYIVDFAPFDKSFDELRSYLTQVISHGNMNIFDYLKCNFLLVLLDFYRLFKSCTKVIAGGFVWLKSFIY